MSPLVVFVRTLLKTSAIFIGTTMVMLHPSLEWQHGRVHVTARTDRSGHRRAGRSAQG